MDKSYVQVTALFRKLFPTINSRIKWKRKQHTKHLLHTKNSQKLEIYSCKCLHTTKEFVKKQEQANLKCIRWEEILIITA